MTERTSYDRHVQMYVEFVDRWLAEDPSPMRETMEILRTLVDGELDGATVCELACGEGSLARYFAPRGPAKIIAVDLSRELIKIARERTDASNVEFRVEDAQRLESVPDASVDVVVSQMAMMDIADHRAVFNAVHRILKPAGPFAFSLLHPAFEGPNRLPDEPQFLADDDGIVRAVAVRYYATEGYWMSGGDGLRGNLGSHHRMLSTYVNDLIETGFTIERFVEPTFDAPGVASQVPRILVVRARAA